jgi:hypothetical protein
VRRRGSAIVAAAVALVAVVAAVDAIRGSSGAADDAPSQAAPTAARKLEARGIHGVLHVTVRRGDGCRLESVRLPDLERSGEREVPSCRVRVSEAGNVAVGDPCPADELVVLTATGTIDLEGCAPAWRPDGTLTFVRNGSVVALTPRCGPVAACIETLVPKSRLPGPIVDLAWVSDVGAAMLVIRDQGNGRSLVIVLDRTVVGDVGPQPASLQAVPGGFGLRIARNSLAGVFHVDRRGRVPRVQYLPRSLADGRALAVSPDRRWVASTSRGKLEIYRLGVARPLDPVELPLDVADVGWAGS